MSAKSFAANKNLALRRRACDFRFWFRALNFLFLEFNFRFCAAEIASFSLGSFTENLRPPSWNHNHTPSLSKH
jgi:hydroxyacyl-ACP dehydratase HTD2-like protein with hotdog domain